MSAESLFSTTATAVICVLVYAMLMYLARPMYFDFDSLRSRLVAQVTIIAFMGLSAFSGYEFSIAVDSGIQHLWQIPFALIGLLWTISFVCIIGIYAVLMLGAWAIGGIGWAVIDIVWRGKYE